MSSMKIKLPEIRFTSYRKFAYIGSLALIVISILSIMLHKGLNYGIDFTGGIVIQTHFEKPIQIEDLRNAMNDSRYSGASIQRYGSSQDFLITFKGDIDREVDTTGPVISAYRTYPNPTLGEKTVAMTITAVDDQMPIKNIFIKSDIFSSVQQVSSLNKFDTREETGQFTLSVEQFVKDTVIVLKAFAVDFADNIGPEKEISIYVTKDLKKAEGVIAEFSDSTTDAASGTVFSPTEGLINIVKDHFSDNSIRIDREEVVGPSISQELQLKSIWVVLLGMLAILLYVWFRFTFRFGVAAVIALFHDVIITVGIFSLLNKEITIPIIAALLTLIGYSINDSIVVSDRIRENIKLMRKDSFDKVINDSLNQTLSRTIITSMTTLLVLLCLFIFGGSVLQDFALALIIGVIVGTYSSIFVVSPLVLDWEIRYPTKKVR